MYYIGLDVHKKTISYCVKGWVAHPLMLRAIAAAKKKYDRIDAGKIGDCLRCDFLPECHMAPSRFETGAALCATDTCWSARWCR